MAPTTWMLTMAFLTVGISLSHEVCFYGEDPHPPGSFWQCVNPDSSPRKPTICECRENETFYYSDLGHCHGERDVHYHSFDNKPFDFQGVCRYVLSRDCCSHAFSIAIQQEQWLNSATAITEAVTLRFANYVIELAKMNPRFRVFHNNVHVTSATPFNTTDLHCNMHGISIFIASKDIGLWFKWDFNWDMDLWVEARYETHTCGICGDFNGNPHNDLDLTSSGDPVTNIRDWGISWRTLIQPSRCSEGNEPLQVEQEGGMDPRNSYDDKYHELCHELIRSHYFMECLETINSEVFIQNCVVEMIACRGSDVPGCKGFGLGPLVKACKDMEYRISEEWKIEAECQDCRFKGMVYEHWMKWVDACHTYQCRRGEVVTLSTTCCVVGEKTYENGATWQTRCHRNRCVSGRVVSVLNGRCRCMWFRERVPYGTVKYHGCYKYTCRENKWVTRRLPCCYHRGTAKYYRTGTNWKCKDFRSGCCECAHNRIVDCGIDRL